MAVQKHLGLVVVDKDKQHAFAVSNTDAVMVNIKAKLSKANSNAKKFC